MCMKYLKFQMIDDESVINQIDELQVLVSKIKDMNRNCKIIPPTWKSYKKKLLHAIEDLSLDQLLKAYQD